MRTFCFESDIGSLVGGDNKSFAAMGGGCEKESVFPMRGAFPFGGILSGESVLRRVSVPF